MNNFSTIKERIRYIADYKNIKKEVFFNQLGMSSANFRGDNLHRPINSNTLEKLVTLFPDINPVWVLTGKGNVLIAESNKVQEPNINYLPSSAAIPLINPATLVKHREDPLPFHEKDIIDHYVIPKFDGLEIEFFLEIHADDSMHPNFKSGDLLGCKRISNEGFMQWGKPHIILTDQGVIIRNIFPVKEKENSIECRAEDHLNYPPFQIKRTAIHSIAAVLGVIHRA